MTKVCTQSVVNDNTWKLIHLLAAGKCYGGVARLKAAVDHINSNVENAIFVNGGDFYQGNVWYTKFKWTVVAAFANKLGFTAMVRSCSTRVNIAFKKWSLF